MKLTITHRQDYRTVASGNVIFRDDVVQLAAPCWSHFVGKSLDEIKRICTERGYTLQEVAE